MHFGKSPLPTLREECQAQHRRCQQFSALSMCECLSCVEIIRLAAAGDREALAILFEITMPIVTRLCPPALGPQQDDIVQEVNLRLLRKFRNTASPFLPSTFLAYCKYVTQTTNHIIYNLSTRDKAHLSLDEHEAKGGYPPTAPSATAASAATVESGLLLQTLLTYLDNPLEREVFRRRYYLDETPEEIVAALQPIAPEMTKQSVYRLIEFAIRRLKKNPLVQQMRADLLTPATS